MIFGKSLAIFVLLGFLLGFSQSLRFDLQSGHTKCIAEDMKANAMTVGKYHVVNPNEGTPLPDTHKVTVRVSISKYSYLPKLKDFKKPEFDLIIGKKNTNLTGWLVLGYIGVWE